MKMIDRLESIIFYFEGSCEICLANKGIEKYRAEVFELLRSGQEFDQEVKLRLYYAHALIEYKITISRARGRVAQARARRSGPE